MTDFPGFVYRGKDRTLDEELVIYLSKESEGICATFKDEQCRSSNSGSLFKEIVS